MRNACSTPGVWNVPLPLIQSASWLRSCAARFSSCAVGGGCHGTDCSGAPGRPAGVERRARVRLAAEDGLAGGSGQEVLVGGGDAVAVEEEQQVLGEHRALAPGEGAPPGQGGDLPSGVLEGAGPFRAVIQGAAGRVTAGGQEGQHRADGSGVRFRGRAVAVVAVRGHLLPAVALLVPVLAGGAQQADGEDDGDLAEQPGAVAGEVVQQAPAVGGEEPVRRVHGVRAAEPRGLGFVGAFGDRAGVPVPGEGLGEAAGEAAGG